MGKKKTSSPDESGVNKTALIKEAMAQNPEASPKDIAATVGHGVTPKYVSTVKFNMGAKQKKGRKKKLGRPRGPKPAVQKAAPAAQDLAPAIAFIKAAGGFKVAKQQIEAIERIKQL